MPFSYIVPCRRSAGPYYQSYHLPAGASMDPNANDRTESLESHLSKLADDMEQFAEQIEVQTKRPALLMVAERLRGKAEVIRLALATG